MISAKEEKGVVFTPYTLVLGHPVTTVPQPSIMFSTERPLVGCHSLSCSQPLAFVLKTLSPSLSALFFLAQTHSVELMSEFCTAVRLFKCRCCRKI